MLPAMNEVLIGSEALASGAVTRYQLSRYRRLLPDVYAPRAADLTLRDHTVAAWLWSRRRAVVAGSAAAALHGAHWVDVDEPVELIWTCARPPAGLSVRNETLHPDEITRIGGIPVTSLTRTAFDLGRHLPRDRAVARLDALMRATPFRAETVVTMAAAHPGVRGVRRLRRALPLVDPGAASPRDFSFSTPAFPARRHRSQWWTTPVAWRSSTWAGRSTRSPRSMTGTSTKPIGGGTCGISAGRGWWRGWAGMRCG